MLALAAGPFAITATSSFAMSQSPSACPATKLPVHPAMPANSPPKMVMASQVAPSDTTTSIVITPDPRDQIRCGEVALVRFDDVVYSAPKKPDGAERPLALDILRPKEGGPRPLVVYIPGGGFIFAQKEGALDLRTYVAEAGFVVASIQYRTALDGATYRDGVADVKSAIRYLRSHADQYGIDPARVAVWGESAGGYLAAMAGVTGDDRSFDTGGDLVQSSAVQAVVDKFGPSDLSRIAADFDTAAQEAYAGPNPIGLYVGGFTPAGMTDSRANPLTHVQRSVPPFLIFSGSQDRMVSPSQTLLLHSALLAAGASSTRYVLQGAGHGDLAFLGDAQSGLVWSSKPSMDVIVEFLRHSLER